MTSGTHRPGRKHSIADLVTVMATLRGPSGCPWDRGQTKQTLKKFLIEEAYEALEAIETGTPESLEEELGDLLLQILFLSRIAEENEEFDFSDVVHTLAEKLIRRHPHVFPPADEKLKALRPRNAKEVTMVWRTVKEQEGKYANRKSLFDGLPLALPALERARRIAERASLRSPRRKERGSVWKKIEGNLTGPARSGKRPSRRTLEARLGDLLFDLADWGHQNGFSAEEALRKANRRLAKRFTRTEQNSR